MKMLRSGCTSAPRVVAVLLLLAGGLAIVAGGRAFAAGPTPTFAVLAPLFMDHDQQQLNTFQTQLAEAKNIGVQAVSVDVWWGKVQPTSQSTFDWSYYTNVFNMIKNAGLKI